MEWNKLKTEFEQFLRDLYPEEPSLVQRAELYSLLAGGKRVRPHLLMATLSGYGTDVKKGFYASAALEMIHTYSLIHDDLPAMDNDVLRRGKPTCHIEFDEATAILAGDGLLTRAFETVSRTDSNHIAELVQELAKAAGDEGMILGQTDDLALEHAEHPSVEDLRNVHHNKTGQLLQVPLVMGAIIAEHPEDISMLRNFGFLLGLAFQIQDDILDVVSSQQELGKSQSDAQNGKSTYVTVLGLDKATEYMNTTYREAKECLKGTSMDIRELEHILDSLLIRRS